MKRLVFSLIASLALSALPACAEKKVQMQTSSSVPAAEGRAILDHDRNGNQRVTIKVKHLAKPENLSPAKEKYVVWIQPEGQDAQNAGVLRVNDDLEGEFRTATPFKKFDVFVTAEDGGTVSMPTGPEVMRQHLQSK